VRFETRISVQKKRGEGNAEKEGKENQNSFNNKKKRLTNPQ
jgi:hypothetical protein